MTGIIGSVRQIVGRTTLYKMAAAPSGHADKS
jgi:hypothetical protein